MFTELEQAKMAFLKVIITLKLLGVVTKFFKFLIFQWDLKVC